jgi:LysM repeat protein
MKSTHFATRELVFKSNINKDPVFLETKELAREINMLIEGKALGADHIHDLFTGIEQQMTAGNQNKTMLGKGAAAVGAVGAKIAGLGQWLKKTTPVQGVDDAWADLKNMAASKLEKSPGGSAVLRNIDKYRQLAAKYPQTSAFFWNAAAVVGGLMSGGLAVPAILGAMKGIDALVQGKEFSSAVGQGLGQFGKTSAVMGAKALATNAAHAAQNIHNPFSPTTTPTTHPGYHDPVYDPPSAGGDPSAGAGRGFVNPPNVVPSPDIQTITVGPTDTLSQIAKSHGTTVPEIAKMNPGIQNVHNVPQGFELKLPANTGATNPYGSNPDFLGLNRSAAQSMNPNFVKENILGAIGYTVYRLPLKEMVDKSATVRKWALNESLGRNRNRSVALTEDGINVVFYNIEQIHKKVLSEAFSDLPGAKPAAGNAMPHLAADPSGTYDTKHKGKVGGGIMDKIEGGLKRAGNWLSSKWKSATTKFEANRAKRRLQDAGIGNDSDAIAQWLISDQKVPSEIITSLYQQLGFPAPAGVSSGADAGASGAAGGMSSGAGAASGGISSGAGAASGGISSGAGAASGGQSSPAEQKAAVKDFQADVDALIRDLMNMNNMQQPAYIKYIRDRLDQHFPAATAKASSSADSDAVSTPRASSSTDSKASTSSAPPMKNKQQKQKQKQKSPATPPDTTKDSGPDVMGKMAKDLRSTKPASDAQSKKPVTMPAKPGVTGTVPKGEKIKFGGDEITPDHPSYNKMAQAGGMREDSRRVYGGKYVKESIDARMLKEFDFFINQQG